MSSEQPKNYKEACAKNDTVAVREAKHKLSKMVRDTEMLSRAAIVYLRGHRDLDVVDEILRLD